MEKLLIILIFLNASIGKPEFPEEIFNILMKLFIKFLQKFTQLKAP